MLEKDYVILSSHPYPIINHSGLYISNLSYLSGCQDGTKYVKVKEALFVVGKPNLIIGESGVGKSLFGRVLSRQYSKFTADIISLNGVDLRSFPSLIDVGDRVLSAGLCHFDTSYRACLGIYIRFRSMTIDPTFFDPVFICDYAKSLDIDINISDFDLEGFTHFDSHNKSLVSEIFSLFSVYHLSHTDFSVFLKSELAIALAYDAYFWDHLKKYIPEATRFFMDAILTEPPISQGQRRRVLYAIDALTPYSLLIIDEPFANIDTSNAKLIFKDLDRYARVNKSVVLILDQQFRRGVYFKKELGFVGEFVQDDNSMNYTLSSI